MATNLFAPNGLSYSRNFLNGANTYQMNQRTIQNGYGSNIGMGDWVRLTSGYVVLATTSDTTTLGVFAGVLGYYDTVQQAQAYGLNGSYNHSSSPSGDVQCLVGMDPWGTFIAQVSGIAFLQSWVGQNITILAGTNGAPNSAGRSTLALDASTVATTSTLPFQIVQEVLPPTGGRLGNLNPWIEVRLNTAQVNTGAGVTGPTGNTGPTGPTGPS